MAEWIGRIRTRVANLSFGWFLFALIVFAFWYGSSRLADMGRDPLDGPESWNSPAGAQDSRNPGVEARRLADAYHRMAVAHLMGDGAPKDLERAITLFREAAAADHPQAAEDLGLLYYSGYGVAPDFQEAARWYARAAKQGQVQAAYSLGLMYASGEGMFLDDTEAARWIRLAADGGLPDAQWSLGLMYGRGQGVRQDHLTAMEWIQRAADNGLPYAREALRTENTAMLNMLFQQTPGPASE